MAKGDDIQEKLVSFAVEIVNLCERLPPTAWGRHIAEQLLRCGTSPAANYAEARGAETRKDFKHKLGIVMKELKESDVWLDIVARKSAADALNIDTMMPRQKSEELCRIIGASLRTLRQ